MMGNFQNKIKNFQYRFGYVWNNRFNDQFKSDKFTKLSYKNSLEGTGFETYPYRCADILTFIRYSYPKEINYLLSSACFWKCHTFGAFQKIVNYLFFDESLSELEKDHLDFLDRDLIEFVIFANNPNPEQVEWFFERIIQKQENNETGSYRYKFGIIQGLQNLKKSGKELNKFHYCDTLGTCIFRNFGQVGFLKLVKYLSLESHFDYLCQQSTKKLKPKQYEEFYNLDYVFLTMNCVAPRKYNKIIPLVVKGILQQLVDNPKNKDGFLCFDGFIKTVLHTNSCFPLYLVEEIIKVYIKLGYQQELVELLYAVINSGIFLTESFLNKIVNMSMRIRHRYTKDIYKVLTQLTKIPNVCLFHIYDFNNTNLSIVKNIVETSSTPPELIEQIKIDRLLDSKQSKHSYKFTKTMLNDLENSVDFYYRLINKETNSSKLREQEDRIRWYVKFTEYNLSRFLRAHESIAKFRINRHSIVIYPIDRSDYKVVVQRSFDNHISVKIYKISENGNLYQFEKIYKNTNDFFGAALQHYPNNSELVILKSAIVGIIYMEYYDPKKP